MDRTPSGHDPADAEVDLRVSLGGLTLQNPVVTASGTFGYGEEFTPFLDLNRLGAFVTKGISLKPMVGTPYPRIAETPAGMLNAIGLQNVGVEAFLAEKLPRICNWKAKVLVNVFGTTFEEYAEVAGRLDGARGVAGLELNISCPNVDAGGIYFGSYPSSTEAVVTAVRKRTGLPLIAKLSPNVTDIVELARAALAGGADALTIANTYLGLVIDISSQKPKLSFGTGGLSGPAIKPITLRMVWEVAEELDVPILASGGICTAEDAVEYLLAGASAVQVGTANYLDPTASIKVLNGIEAHCRQRGVKRVTDLVGRAHQA